MINHKKASRYFPEAYEGNIKKGDEHVSIVELATQMELDTILKRFGDWVITTEGIDCLTKSYFIPKDKLDEENWLDDLSERFWVNKGDFELAFYSAKDLIRLGVL